MSIERETIYLVDISSLIFRAFFAIPSLSSPTGHPTNATYGVLNMLERLIEKNKPNYLACVFDSPKPSFRHQEYKEYKANRGAPPDLLIPQFADIRRSVRLLGVAQFEEPGYEADDLIGTLAKKFSSHYDVVIVSSDKDLMQLVDDNVTLLDTMKDKTYGNKEVFEKLGVLPTQVADYLGLIGDSSDNIPGVPGIGPKTAAELLAQYKTLDGVFDNLANLKGKRRETLESHVDIARLSKKLATIDCAANSEHLTEIQIEQMRYHYSPSDEFFSFLREFGFLSLEKKWPRKKQADVNLAEVSIAGHSAVNSCKTECIVSREQLQKILQLAMNSPVVAFDTETLMEGPGLSHEKPLVGFSLCYDSETAYYIPVRHSESPSSQLNESESLPLLKEFFASYAGTIVGHNLKFDFKILLRESILAEAVDSAYSHLGKFSFFDTMVAHYLTDPEAKHGLDAVSQSVIGKSKKTFEQTIAGVTEFSQLDLAAATEYAAGDAWLAFMLMESLKKQLDAMKMSDIFFGIEMPLIPVLAQMELEGVLVDSNFLNELSVRFAVELKQIEKVIFERVGHEFNLNSPKQLSQVLFEELKLPIVRKTKTGFSTDVDVLERLSLLHEVPVALLRFREINKLKNTYVDVLPRLVDKNGRIHTSFQQTVTATGRLSSADPNLQNIPVKTVSGREVRRAFVAAQDKILIGADYSQIELRVVAHLSGDVRLREAFLSGKDVHNMTAQDLFHVSEVSDDQRRIAKAINFGLIYGKTPFGLSQELGISRAQANQYIETYFEKYSGVRAFMDRCISDARKLGYAETLFGRRRQIRDIDSKNMAVRNNAERMAMNTPVQGTAADIIKRAMVKLHEGLLGTSAKLLLQVHDELIIECTQDFEEEAKKILVNSMESAAELTVPLTVNVGSGRSWFELS